MTLPTAPTGTSTRPTPSLDVARVLGECGLLERELPGFELRTSQLEMAHAVERTLLRKELLLVEAGTGTGKTLAYLVPAILSGQKVVVSTGTKALQDQIMQKDVPLLARVLGRPLDVACMKGLGNYLCLRRLDERKRSAASLGLALEPDLARLLAWAERTESGDLSELTVLPEHASIRGDVHSGSDTRIGPKCSFFESCFVTQMRRRAEAAQIVVVNHHLFFADLALRAAVAGGKGGGAGVIPEHDAIVFDEAHLLEDIATDFFGISVSSTRVAVLVRDAGRTLAAHELAREGDRFLTQVASSAAELFSMLPQPAETGRAPLSRNAFDDGLRDPMLALDSALDGLASLCRRRADLGEPVAQIARRAELLRTNVAQIADGGGKGYVTWVIARGRSRPRQVSIGASPIDVASTLREELFLRGQSIVLTSATLTTSGSFDYVRSRLGLDADVSPEERVLASPFDYPSQAALYLPRHVPDPRSAEYLDAAEREISELCELTGGGAFVLCTSLRVMRELGRRLAARLRFPILVQGNAPHASLLEAFRHAGNAVLVATASFWQGVDVKGDALRLVVIDKLPFDVPSDPLVAARCERLQEQGEAPFMRYLVPSAALTLKQGFGRLIRGSRDKGIVAILDPRVTKKSYGRVFLSSLPPAARCHSIEEVRAFVAANMRASLGAPGATEL